MDYDTSPIAAHYDAARDYRPDVLAHWLEAIARHIAPNPRRIIDLGCGTGRFTYPLAQRFATHVVGIDPSQSMLDVAKAKDTMARVDLIRAVGERLPLASSCADVVFMSMV